MLFSTFYASFFASMAFGILFNVPRKALIPGGLVGMIGWVIYISLSNIPDFNLVTATFISAFCVATISQYLARFLKMPVTIFSISGIIPLVPGGTAYDSVLKFLENNYIDGIRLASLTLLLAGAIAFGLIFSGVITETFRHRGSIHQKGMKQ